MKNEADRHLSRMRLLQKSLQGRFLHYAAASVFCWGMGLSGGAYLSSTITVLSFWLALALYVALQAIANIVSERRHKRHMQEMDEMHALYMADIAEHRDELEGAAAGIERMFARGTLQ